MRGSHQDRNQQQQDQQQPRLTASLNAGEPTAASSNLLNLATIDNAFFNQQQNQLRAEQQQQQQQLSRPFGSPSSNASTECLSLDRASTSTTSSSTSSSGQNQAGHSVKAHAKQPVSQSDTTDDIQSLASQFNLCLHQQQQQQQQHFTMHHSQEYPSMSGSNLQQQQHQHPERGATLDSPAAMAAAQQQQHQQQSSFIQGHGHYFTKKTFHKPTYCHHCADMLWGLIGQGYICEVCNFVVHERCIKTVVSCCSTVASSAIKNPMPHCWVEAHPKRKFCNVCRKRIEDNAAAIRCSVCEYCVHCECQEFSISDCRECATYVPDQSLADVSQQHHWREGNLPTQQSSKCYWCKKSCFSAECLTGMRCEWCQTTMHASCLKHAPRDCNLGCLQSIMLPPYCISIPRTDVPMETIIGVQSGASRVQSSAASSPSTLLQQTLSSAASLSSVSSSGVYSSSSVLNAGGPATAGNAPSAATVNKRDNLSPRQTSEDFCQTNLYYQLQEESRDRDEEVVKVYDGNSSLKKRSFRLISVPKLIQRDELIAACLRAFYIHDDVAHYALIDITDGERELRPDEPYPIVSMLSPPPPPSADATKRNYDNSRAMKHHHHHHHHHQHRAEQQVMQPPPALLLRYRPPDSFMGTIRIYPGRLNVSAELTYSSVEVTSDTSVEDVIRQALDKFRLRTNDLNRFRLVEVSLDKGSSVHERTMDNSECPWEIIKNVARESVRQKENTRFYLQQQDEVYCSSVAIFVGNLPTNLSQKQYEQMLMEHLGKPYRFKSINPIYYEYGSCIITYDNADIAVKAFYMLRESTIKQQTAATTTTSGSYSDQQQQQPAVENKSLVVLLLPNIVPEMIPEGVRPLLVFVNVKSGGCQGLDLITSFRRLLNPYQVYDLENGGPLPGLYVFRNLRDYKILVSGGDGSVGWVLQCLDNVGQDSECQSPPCAIIPLGTGNDLARVLRWGSGFTGAEDPINFLKDIIDAEEVILDRWTVVFHSDEASKQEFPSSLTMTPGAGSGAEDNAAIFVMNNYLGIGLDADLCLGFHNAREENPDKFNSRLHNKGVYVKQAIRKMVNRSSWNNLNKAVRLEVDGKAVQLPHVEGIIILNILSWGSGANPWGPEQEERFVKPTHYDGMLEVVGVTGIVHMGQIQSGLSRAIRIAQGGRIKIRLNTEMPIQVDGEPWIQSACEVNIIRSALKATMLRKIKMKRRNTEPSINQEQLQQQQQQQAAASGGASSGGTGGDS